MQMQMRVHMRPLVRNWREGQLGKDYGRKITAELEYILGEPLYWQLDPRRNEVRNAIYRNLDGRTRRAEVF